MNLAKFDRILREVLILPILAVSLAACALFFGIRETTNTVQRIQQADAAIAQATLVQKLVVDEEDGVRGYQTTGDRRFLEPFDQASIPLNAAFIRLKSLLQEYPDDVRDVERLQSAHTVWLEGFARSIIQMTGDGVQTSEVDLNIVGKAYMDAIRGDLQNIIQDSEARRGRRIDAWHHQVQLILIALIVVAVLTGAFIGLLARTRLKQVSMAFRLSGEVLERRANELFASEQNLRTTLASIGDGVITCDPAGRIQMMNEVAQELTGWKQEQAMGLYADEIFHLLHEGTREAINNPWTDTTRLEHGHSRLLVRKDGSELLVDDKTAVIRDKSGDPTGVVTVMRDITNERKTQAALLANEKLAVAGRLAASIAHEIHNPLDAVSNLLYLMSSGSTQEETAQFLNMAQQELARVMQISRSMLGLYRESKAPVAVDVREMVVGLLLLLERRFQTMGVSVTETVPAGLCIDGFPAELRQVFTNLIINAAEAAAANEGGRVSVTAAALLPGMDPKGARHEEGALITVTDNGGGMTPAVRERLFHPFFTTKGEQGTGLGLWVSHGIIRKHGGSIEIESSTDEQTHGTSVSVFLASKPVIQPGAD